MSKYVKHPLLPKSNLITIKIFSHKWIYYTTRMANARQFFVLRNISIVVRRPWLKGPAKQLHPELFNKPEVRDGQ
ncbi:hypothetical protein [Serratia marcescens]|uniref:hypothetical protein n=1 Tax=Serratia marcescens TaxID=615 RepID=UPI00398982F0